MIPKRSNAAGIKVKCSLQARRGVRPGVSAGRDPQFAHAVKAMVPADRTATMSRFGEAKAAALAGDELFFVFFVLANLSATFVLIIAALYARF